MEETAIISLWKSYHTQLQQSLALNRKNAEDITKIKVQSLLGSMKPLKLFAVVAGIIWVIFLNTLIFNLAGIASPFFLASAIIQSLLTTLAIGIYLYQLVLINQVDISEPVVLTQYRLARLISSTLWVARLLFLQLPVWTIFYWNKSMLDNGNILLYLLQAAVTIAFTCVSVWLFTHIKYENRNKKWFRLIFNGKEWNPVMKSIELLQEIEEYKKEG